MFQQYRFTELFNLQGANPYVEDTRAWHVWIDFCVCLLGSPGTVINLDALAKYHDQTIEYYIDALDEMTEDGYLTKEQI